MLKLKIKRTGTITKQDYQDCINAAYKAGRAKKTLKNIRASLTAVYTYAEGANVELINPVGLKIPKDAPVKQRNILQPEKIAVLFTEDTIIKSNRPQHCFLIYYWRALVLTGLRPGELAGLQKGDIKGNKLVVNRSINNLDEITPGKNKNARREQILTPQLTKVLKDQEQMLKKLGIISPWIFPGEDGEQLRPREAYWRWEAYYGQHDLQCSLYELRHTMVSLTKTDVPEPLLKRILGHGITMDSLGVYGHEVDGELERAAKMIGEVFSSYLPE